MNVSLTLELEKFIADKVQSGMYYSASEVVREALRLLKEQNEFKRHRLLAMRRNIDAGFGQLERGEAISGEEVFEKLRRKSQERRRKRA
ncbi:MAG: type II toxin-antitoxin system ParD family antitoxin [Acidobacteria bacterium]|nr:type II toxin-antitoxin system ParD family antitoxin [Acidobacteriota bacterium]MCH8269554.1 type II toxin-antitoxin system ParD family antitoxin [Acidobacteriota bacterium]